MKIMVLLEIAASGEKLPRKFNRSVFSDEIASKKAYIIINDFHKKIYLWLGSDLSRIHRRVAQRSSGFARGHGHEVDGYVVGRSFDVIELDESEGAELPSDLIDVFDMKLDIHDEYSVIASDDSPGGFVKTHTESEVVMEKFEQRITHIIEDTETEGEQPSGVTNKIEPRSDKTPEPMPSSTPVESQSTKKTSEEQLKTYAILPKLLDLPEDQKNLYIEGLIQEALLTIEETGMVSHGVKENSFILFSNQGELLGTILLDPVRRDELVYKAIWTRETDEEKFARLLSSLSS